MSTCCAAASRRLTRNRSSRTSVRPGPRRHEQVAAERRRLLRTRFHQGQPVNQPPIAARVNVAGATTGMSRTGLNTIRSTSPDTMRSALPFTASSRNLSSVWSRHAAMRSAIATGSGRQEGDGHCPETRAASAPQFTAGAKRPAAGARFHHLSAERTEGRRNARRWLKTRHS